MFFLTKTPAATLDYKVDWVDWLDGDTIASSTWLVDDQALVVESDSNTLTTATAWVSGGVDGLAYVLSNHITTAAGRIDVRSIKISIQDQ